jgi:2-dehydropantoate 2-reductase
VSLRVVVVGPGAVGSFLGGMLAASGASVTLLGRRPPSGGSPDALRVEDVDGTRSLRVTRTDDAARLPVPDLVILAVKQFDLPGALEVAARWPEAAAMTVQNGIGAETMAAARRTSRLLAGSLTSAVEPAPGGVRRLRKGGLGVAVVRGDAGTLATELVTMFSAAGLPAVLFVDAGSMKWSKLLANLVANATSALLDMDPHAIYDSPLTFPIERRQLLEARAVMRGLGVHPVSLPGAHVQLLLRSLRLPPLVSRPFIARAIGRARGGKSPSLRLHVRGEAAGPTEAYWLNGAVAREGERLAIPTPVNAGLAALVDEAAADPDRAAWFEGRPDRLREALDAWEHAAGG